MPLEPTLAAYGYTILYLGTILEGETFLIISAVLRQTGHLEIIWVICTAFLGVLSGDLFCFHIGRFDGGKFLKKRMHWQKPADKAYRLLQRHQSRIVFSHRFFYGLRAVIPFLIGTKECSFRRFLLLSSAGAMVWSVTLTVAGFVCGKVLLLFLADMKHYQLLFIGGFAIFGLLCWAIYHLKNRHFD
jgi:membrane protein DedA with SNARE-associated domain